MSAERDDRLIDLAVDQLAGEERERALASLADDARSALEVAELRTMLADLRELRTEPSGRVGVTLHYALRRRARLRGGWSEAPPRRRWSLVAVRALQVAAVAAGVLAALLLGRAELRREVPRGAAVSVAISAPLPRPAPPPAAPVDDVPGFDEILARAGSDFGGLERHLAALRALRGEDVFGSLAAADHDLAWLRVEFVQRFSRQARRASIAASGGKPDLEDRIQDLAADVAAAVGVRLARGEASVGATALALRAMMAAGSTPRIGRYRRIALQCVEHLKARIGDLEGGELASALAALTDLAVVTYGQAGALVGEHGARLARATLQPGRARAPHSGPESGAWCRPALLRFETPVECLADAGYVLRLAPAFGVHPSLAHRARLLIAAHVEERLAVDAGGGRPDVLAAQLYGFGDLADRREVDRKLVLWNPRLLLPNYRALHHLAWSQYPPRPGWARFQTELRGLASLQTPPRVEDSSALLLCLAMNFAAPGVHEVLELAR
jgi:hypothetical protein